MELQTRVQNLVAFESSSSQRKLLQPDSMLTLLKNLIIAVPRSMGALTPRIAPFLSTGADREAVMAADLLQMQLNAPSMPTDMRVDILSKLLDAVASGSEAVRLRITTALPEITQAAMELPVEAGGQPRIVDALMQRLLDPGAAVRVAAVRGLGHLCTRTSDDELSLRIDGQVESNPRAKMLQGMVERLRDCVVDVREAVRTFLSYELTASSC